MVKDNLASCLARIEAAGQGAGQVTLIAVTKGVALPLIFEAIDAGAVNLGESKVQEALLKYGPVNDHAKGKNVSIIWHMVGHLQTNKVRDAVRIFDLIHSVDSIKLAIEIDKEAGKQNKIQDVLLEVKTSTEATKYGFSPDEACEAAKKMSVFKNISVKGLMTIAPPVDAPEKARPYFRKIKELQDDLSRFRISNLEFRILSMGMTDDFQAAIQEGATMVRIGRGIFGERKYDKA